MNNNLLNKENKMLEIDDSIQTIIDPDTWKRLPAIKKLRVFKLFEKIYDIVNTPDFF